MRYPKDQKDKTRQQILDAAARVFRRHGFQAGSVDVVMKEAGLTAGGFYAHFESKTALFAEAILGALQKGKIVFGRDTPELEGAELIRSVAAKYLSSVHREHIDQGCVLPPLLADLPRQDEAVRREFQTVLSEAATALRPHAAGGESETVNEGESDQGWAILAMLVGGMSLARAVADKDLSDRILLACRLFLATSLDSNETEREGSSEPPPSSSRPRPPSSRRKK